MDYRLINKFFKCPNCFKRFKKLVSADTNKVRCDECLANEAEEVIESEFDRELADREYRMVFDDDEMAKQYHTRMRFTEEPTTGTSQQRMPNGQTSPRVNQQQAPRGRQTYAQQQVPPRTETPRQQTRAQATQQPQNLFSNLFGNGSPFDYFALPFGNTRTSPFSGNVQRQSMNESVFDPIFSSFFGSGFNDFFMDNFSSNFNSNFADPMTRIIFINTRGQHPEEHHRPTSEEALKNLKKFKMNENYCKKNEKGELEYPTCSVCLADIGKDNESVLLPCGHLYHEDCVTKWLKSNNTCPVCRFELPTYSQNTSRERGTNNGYFRGNQMNMRT